MSISTLTSLDKRFQQEVDRVNVLFELGINAETLHELRSEIKVLVKQWDLSGATERLFRWHRNCLAVYLVAEGIYGYESGNFWSGTPVSGSAQYQRMWGQFFLRYISNGGLERFSGVGGRVYVDPILLHGGIPNSALPAFVEHCLWPALQRGANPADGAELRLRWGNAHTQFHLTIPAANFLRYGGLVATDFVERCLDMGYHWASENALPRPSELGLPQRVVHAFKDFLEKAPDARTSVKTAQRLPALRTPRFRLDPFGDGPYLEFPSQIVVSPTSPDVRWDVSGEGPDQEYPAFVSRMQGGWQTESMQVSPGAPARRWSVSFHSKGYPRQWHFTGPTATTPFLAFDATSLELLSSESLPASHVWLVFQRMSVISIPDTAKVLQDAVFFLGAWEGWTCKCYDLTGCEGKSFTVDGKTVSIHANAGAPYLTGGKEAAHSTPDAPIYLTLPELRIPITGARTPEEEASRWEITIVGQQSTISLGRLDQISPSIRELGSELAEILDGGVLGQYLVRLRGPLGRSVRLPFTYIGSVSISEPPPLRLPTSNAWPAATFKVRIPATWRVTTYDNDVRINSIRDGRYEVTLPGTRASGSIDLTDPTGQNRFTLPVIAPALYWALVENGSKGRFGIHGFQRPRAILDTPDGVELLVGVAPLGSIPLPEVILEVQSNGRRMSLRPLRAGRGLVRFNLREATEFTEGAGHTVFKLKVQGKELSVLTMTEHLHIEHLTLDLFSEGDQARIVARWTEVGRILPNRRLRLWPLSRPWHEPIEESIPDEVTGQFEFRLDRSVLSPGKYRAEITLVDPWGDQTPVLPGKDATATIDVQVGNRQEYLEYLNQLEDTFEGHLEAALAFEYAEPEKCRHHLQEMVRLFEPTDMPLLVASILGSREDDEAPLASSRRNPQESACRLFLDHADRFAIELADRASRVSNTERNVLVHFLIGTGLLDEVFRLARTGDLADSELESLWHFWPVLGLIAEANLILKEHPDAWKRMEDTTGMASILTPCEDDDPPQLVNVLEAGELFGVPLDRELTMAADQLRAAGAFLGLAPRGALEQNSDQALLLDWLLGVREDRGGARVQQAREELLRYGKALRNALDDVAQLDAEFRALKERICYRFRPGPIDTNDLDAIPFTVGTVALIARALAHSKANMNLVSKHRNMIRQLIIQAHIAAPDLLTRDLCLIELSLAQVSFAVAPISPVYADVHS